MYRESAHLRELRERSSRWGNVAMAFMLPTVLLGLMFFIPLLLSLLTQGFGETIYQLAESPAMLFVGAVTLVMFVGSLSASAASARLEVEYTRERMRTRHIQKKRIKVQ